MRTPAHTRTHTHTHIHTRTHTHTQPPGLVGHEWAPNACDASGDSDQGGARADERRRNHACAPCDRNAAQGEHECCVCVALRVCVRACVSLSVCLSGICVSARVCACVFACAHVCMPVCVSSSCVRACECVPVLLCQAMMYLFGSPITHSPSPLMHNTSFAQCGRIESNPRRSNRLRCSLRHLCYPFHFPAQ